MPEIYRAANIEEAVEIAVRLREEGRYNWFRGQVHDWPPYSSARRIQAADDEKSSRRLSLFLDWVKQTPELKEPLNDPAAIAAVAQHYGIPSNYIDFSTEPGVAGFFAADGKAPSTGEVRPCIFCLNTDDLLEVWDAVKDFRPEAHLELVNIDVSNLWRLEAQHGCFLYCDYNWDVDYPMDRILFPSSGLPSWPTRNDIYPPQKSPLEALLDQYFDVEQKTLSAEYWYGVFQQMEAQGKNAHWHLAETPKDGYHPEAIKTADIPLLASWNPAVLKGWAVFNVERIEAALAAPVTLQVNPSASSTEAASSVSYGVRQVLNTKRDARQFTFSWQFQGLSAPKSANINTLSEALQAVCDGMRRLPYTNAEIAAACGTTTHLFLEGFSLDPSLLVAQRVLDDCFQVEFGVTDGSSSRGYIRRKSLQSALRADLDRFASDRLMAATQDDVRRVLQAIFSPARLLEFEALRSIFANELIPTQALSRKLVLYSPARLLTFGLP